VTALTNLPKLRQYKNILITLDDLLQILKEHSDLPDDARILSIDHDYINATVLVESEKYLPVLNIQNYKLSDPFLKGDEIRTNSDTEFKIKMDVETRTMDEYRGFTNLSIHSDGELKWVSHEKAFGVITVYQRGQDISEAKWSAEELISKYFNVKNVRKAGD
jgi:hypothetical protein